MLMFLIDRLPKELSGSADQSVGNNDAYICFDTYFIMLPPPLGSAGGFCPSFQRVHPSCCFHDICYVEVV